MAIDITRIVRDDKGRFAGYASGETDASTLTPTAADERRAARAAALASNGYVPAVATLTPTPAATTDHRAQWWATNFANAEYGHESGDRLAMPDDYTPKRTSGLALSGHRRTHRMRYQTAPGVETRMPSKTSIKRFADEHHNRTFDVPVSATIDGRHVTGWVRVTKGADGQWDAQGVGFPNKSDELRIAESVSMTLEGQRAPIGPAAAGYLSRHREQRLRAGGSVEHPLRSSWIKSTSFTPDAVGAPTGTMTMTTRDRLNKNGSTYHGPTYTGRIDAKTYHEFIGSEQPGAYFNEHIKGRAGIERAQTCPDCGLVTTRPHAGSCPTVRQSPREPGHANRDPYREYAARQMAARRRH